MHVLLSGIVGSTAYGLAHKDSDVDRLGVFAAPTAAFHGLHRPQETITKTDPDLTYHEIGKWCRLALSGNPTVMELVWLPDSLCEKLTPLGEELIDLRSAFLCAPRVRGAYLGYAQQQFQRLQNRGDGSFSADTRKRTEKHARHLMRLCIQGYTLYTTGQLEIMLENPEEVREFGERVAERPESARSMLNHYETLFNEATSCLPDRPDERVVNDWLIRVRHVMHSSNNGR